MLGDHFGEKLQNKLIQKSNSKRTSFLVACALILLAVGAGILLNMKSRFNPSKVSEAGQYHMSLGESIQLNSIDSTLTFSDATIENINLDSLLVDLSWTITLCPETTLQPNDDKLIDKLETWVQAAHYNTSSSANSFGLAGTNFSTNSIKFTAYATVPYDVDVQSMTYTINDNLSFVLEHSFSYSSNELLMEKADRYFENGDYDSAIEIYDRINTPEAITKINGINCISYAQSVTNKLAWDNILPAVLGFYYSFNYDPETYSYYQIIEYDTYLDDLASISASLGGSNAILSEQSLMKMAEDLYFDYFYPAGFLRITCIVEVYNSNGEKIGSFPFSAAEKFSSKNGGLDEDALAYHSYMRDFVIENNVLLSYNGDDRNVVVPDGVTKIGIDAFKENKYIERVQLPDSVIEISHSAFYYCEELTEINLPNSLQTIGNTAFYKTGLRTLKIPASIVSVGNDAFLYSKIKNLSFESGIKTIPKGFGDLSITKLVIPEGVVSIQSYAFSYCTRLKSISLPSTLTQIGKGAFNDCWNVAEILFAGSDIQWESIEIGQSNEDLWEASITFAKSGSSPNESKENDEHYANEEDSPADPQFTEEPSQEPSLEPGLSYYSLIVKYVDTDGNLIIEPIVEDGKQEGRNYATTQKYFDGYEFCETEGDSASGKMDSDKTVIYVYKKIVYYYEADTVAANLSEFRSLIVDNEGVVYYINGDIICNTVNGLILNLASGFEKPLTNACLAYDYYRDIVYLLSDRAIYDISDFSDPKLLMNSDGNSTLLKAGKIAFGSGVAPQVAVLEDGSLVVPYDSGFTYLIAPSLGTMSKFDKIYSTSQADYAKIVGNNIVWFNTGKAEAEVTPISGGSEYTMKLSPEAPDGNASTISSRDGWVCFYEDGIGLCGYATDGNAYILIPLKEIRADDNQSLDNTNIWCLDVSIESGVTAFYDNTLKCIRCIRPLP